MDYTLRELMVVAVAREIRDGERVFVGMRLPLLGFAVAKEFHASKELGAVRKYDPNGVWTLRRGDQLNSILQLASTE